MAHAEIAAPPRSVARLLVDRNFGLFTWGRFFSTAAVWVHGVVAAIAIYSATGSALAVGLVTAVQFGPQLFTPLSGKWADHGDVKRQILLGRVVCATGAGGAALFYAIGTPVGWTAAWGILFCSLVVGIGFVIGGPAMQAATPALVTREELPAAMTLNTAPMTAARLAGPALGAFIVTVSGSVAGFACAALGHLLCIAAVMLVKIPRKAAPSEDVDYSVRAGLRHVWTDRPLLFLLIAIAAVGFASEPTITLAPALAAELGGGPELVGALTMSFGVGALAGVGLLAIFARRIVTEVFVATGLAVMVCGAVLAAATAATPIVLAGFGVIGTGFSLAVTAIGTGIQLRIPVELRGRIMALWLVAFTGPRPVGSLLTGLIADLTTAQFALATMAVAPALALVLCRPSSLRRTAANEVPAP
ncbi:MFS transporter [Hoyosella altamirensis]|uniref:Putative MFS family arabinose efflux permease n=1 Tax=Hoyosella altamirensis TaxID=616997 RepID=A0A839RPS9_9ACTN|nr:MFS transporter [Hoyosella altamirensis]MBB3038319.1 putative MFS family arabinose efflux permease [Hoyosella altamirensis]